MLLPITFALSPLSSLIMLAGIYYGAQYGGSTTAILINLPGEASSAVTTIDGYQMAQQGRAGPALAAAAIGSFFAGTVATLLIAMFAPAADRGGAGIRLARIFRADGAGPGRLRSRWRSGSVFKALAMVVRRPAARPGRHRSLYRSAALHSWACRSCSTASTSWPIAVGLFGICRNLPQSRKRARTARPVIARSRSLWPSPRRSQANCRADLARHRLGSLLGVLPGGGALLASFAAYALEKKISTNSARVRQGCHRRRRRARKRQQCRRADRRSSPC